MHVSKGSQSPRTGDARPAVPTMPGNRAQPAAPKHLKTGEMGKHGSLSSQSPREGNRLPSPVPSHNHAGPPRLEMCQLMGIKCNVQFLLLLAPAWPNLLPSPQLLDRAFPDRSLTGTTALPTSPSQQTQAERSQDTQKQKKQTKKLS